MIVLYVFDYFNRNKQNSYAALRRSHRVVYRYIGYIDRDLDIDAYAKFSYDNKLQIM